MRWPKIPKCHFGFPIGEDTPARAGKESGVAIIIAMLTVTVMVTMIAGQIMNSTVQAEMAIGNRDKIKAEYLAKSGLNLGIFLLSTSLGMDLFMASSDQIPQNMRKARSDGPSSLWAVFNSLPPIGASTVEMVTSASKGKDGEEKDPFGVKGILNEKIADQMKQFEDDFSVLISDEQAKINVNDCRSGKCTNTLGALLLLFSGPAEKLFLESKNIDPEELAYRIKDFISGRTSEQSGYSDVNEVYKNKKPPYTPKGLALDSIEELRNVEGWDDDLHAIFSPYLAAFLYTEKDATVTTININTAPKELMTALIPEALDSSCVEKFEASWAKLAKDSSSVAEAPGDIQKKLTDMFCYSKRKDDDNPLFKDRNTWFGVKSDVFRVEITANTGGQSVLLSAVIRRIEPKDKNFKREDQLLKRSYSLRNWSLR